MLLYIFSFKSKGSYRLCHLGPRGHDFERNVNKFLVVSQKWVVVLHHSVRHAHGWQIYRCRDRRQLAIKFWHCEAFKIKMSECIYRVCLWERRRGRGNAYIHLRSGSSACFFSASRGATFHQAFISRSDMHQTWYHIIQPIHISLWDSSSLQSHNL